MSPGGSLTGHDEVRMGVIGVDDDNTPRDIHRLGVSPRHSGVIYFYEVSYNKIRLFSGITELKNRRQ